MDPKVERLIDLIASAMELWDKDCSAGNAEGMSQEFADAMKKLRAAALRIAFSRGT